MDEALLRQRFVECFPSEIELYEKGTLEWEEVVREMPFVPVAYWRSSLDETYCEMCAFMEDVIDLSIIIKDNNECIGIWPLFLCKSREGVIFSTPFAPTQFAVLPPIYKQKISERMIRKYDNICITAIKEFYSVMQDKLPFKKEWDTAVSFLPSALQLQNLIWESKCMMEGGRATVVHDLYVDLMKSEEEIHQSLRKSYRSLINQGERLWNVEVHDHVDAVFFDEYRLLHKKVSGHVTRPLETWRLQCAAINSGNAFLVTLRDCECKLIGGGFFEMSSHEGSYSVGVYDRSLFDKPVSHVVQWAAVKHLKKLGRRWYYVGQRFYSGDPVPPTDKELSIAYFKEGFATDMVLRLLLKMAF